MCIYDCVTAQAPDYIGRNILSRLMDFVRKMSRDRTKHAICTQARLSTKHTTTTKSSPILCDRWTLMFLLVPPSLRATLIHFTFCFLYLRTTTFALCFGGFVWAVMAG